MGICLDSFQGIREISTIKENFDKIFINWKQKRNFQDIKATYDPSQGPGKGPRMVDNHFYVYVKSCTSGSQIFIARDAGRIMVVINDNN